MYAVIKTGGKQYRVAADDVIEIDKIPGEAGEAVAFGEVLAVGGEDTVLGTPTVAGASVAGEVVEQGRKPKVIAFIAKRLYRDNALAAPHTVAGIDCAALPLDTEIVLDLKHFRARPRGQTNSRLSRR